MAGIGFVLQKVLKEDSGVLSFIKVALAGTIIVAGPWLLSIVGIFVIGRFASTAIAESSIMFMAVIIYSYAFSLFIFGGIHYIFTRRVADLIFEELNRKAGATLLLFSIIISILAGIVAYFAIWNMDLGLISHKILFRIGSVVLFVGINLIWLIMIFISLLKKYILIFLVYMGGMAASFGGVLWLGNIYGTGGAMLGFALGQWAIVLFLYFLAFWEYTPANFDIKGFLHYFYKFRYLLFSGILYYWGMWIDKLIFWFFKGTRVENTFFHVFDLYDIPVYLSNLTIIPGLIFFMIVSETNFYHALITFLKVLHTSIFKEIQIRKYEMISVLKKGIKDQTSFQSVFTIILFLVSSYISLYLFDGTLNVLVFRITLLAVFFHLMFLTLTIYLFYVQLFRITFLTNGVYFLVNLIGSILTVLLGNSSLIGVSYLVASVIGSVLSYIFLIPAVRRFDRILFIQAATGE